jgi:hypothetical protein
MSSNLGRRKGRDEGRGGEEDPSTRPKKRGRVEVSFRFLHGAKVFAALTAALLPVIHGDIARLVASYLDQPNMMFLRPMSDDEVIDNLNDPTEYHCYLRAEDRTPKNARIQLKHAVNWIQAQHLLMRKTKSSKRLLSETPIGKHIKDLCIFCFRPKEWSKGYPRVYPQHIKRWLKGWRPLKPYAMPGIELLCSFHNPAPRGRKTVYLSQGVITHGECVEWQ